MSKVINYRGAEKEIFDSHATESWPLGTRMYTENGRVFRRAKASATALAIGTCVRKPENEAGHSDLAIATAVDAGVLTFTVTLTYANSAFDAYKDGVIYINDAGGQGHVYNVVGNTAHNIIGTTTMTVDINAPLKTALTTSSRATFIKNRYNGVRISERIADERALGIVPAAVTASYYFWLQTGGPAAVLQDGTLFENRDVVPSIWVRGAVMAASSARLGQALSGDHNYKEREALIPSAVGAVATNVVGYSLDPRVDTDYSLIQLTLD